MATFGANELLLNEGDGTFTPASGFPGNIAAARSVVFGDVDGGGDLDALGQQLGASELLLNRGDGTLPASGFPGGSADTISVVFGDVTATAISTHS